MIALAERLGRTIAEVERMTASEFNEWRAYFRVKEEILGDEKE